MYSIYSIFESMSFTLFSSAPGGNGSPKVLAKDSQSQGGDVPERAGGDPGRHRAV